MEKIARFQHPIAFYNKSRSKLTSQNLVWVPKKPRWEKEFCCKAGSFTWEYFLEAKKRTRLCYKILEWNDSAAEEAFRRSKRRFFAMINGLPYSDEYDDDLNPDLYIDEIHWDHAGGENSHAEDEEDEDEDEDEDEYEYEDEEEEVNENGDEVIIPTGWDCKDEEFSAGKFLMGYIVGY